MMSAELARSIVADILKEEQATDLVELFDIMDGSLGRMLSLISDILTMAEAGQKPELVSEVAISDIVSAIAGEKAADIRSGRLDLKVDENLCAVIANHTQMYQLFLNLISNAIKHNDSDSLVVQVRYLGDDHRGGHRYLVRDNGTGIAQENLDKIFQPFFKSGKSADAGVGLATVDKIVKVHRGDIKAYNDGGACFEFVIRDLGD
jgi:signal transduction histidine kinase